MENKLDLLPLLDYIDPSILGGMLEDTTQMNAEKNGRRSEVIPAHQ